MGQKKGGKEGWASSRLFPNKPSNDGTLPHAQCPVLAVIRRPVAHHNRLPSPECQALLVIRESGFWGKHGRSGLMQRLSCRWTHILPDKDDAVQTRQPRD